MNLHIGGKHPAPGWVILDIAPGPHVDHVGNCTDLSAFADDTFETVYASHVLEHLDYRGELARALGEMYRVLKPGGLCITSTPDLETICHMFLTPGISDEDKQVLMEYLFGGHRDPHDYHQTGVHEALLFPLLKEAGFTDITRLDEPGPFPDHSHCRFQGRLISLNVEARKPTR